MSRMTAVPSNRPCSWNLIRNHTQGLLGRIALPSVLASEDGQQFDEPRNHNGVERLARLCPEDADGVAFGHGPAREWTVGGQCLEVIGAGDDTGAKRNLGAPKARGVSGSVPIVRGGP